MSGFVLTRYLRFLDKYPAMMEKKFPTAVNVYRVFVLGFKDFLNDVKEYVLVRKKVLLEPEGLRSLTRKEMSLYARMPKEMLRVGPTLLISALPFANYVVLPIAYYFPKHLLSSHFLTKQQINGFASDNQKQKLLMYDIVLRRLHKNAERVKNEEFKSLAKNTVHSLESGKQLTIKEIMPLKPVFENEFELGKLSRKHLKSLCGMHGLHAGWLRKMRLFEHAKMIHEMDVAILRDGIYDLTADELREACFLRGLNARTATVEDMIDYLHEWMPISVSIQSYSFSLLLHLPLLLAYNHQLNLLLLTSHGIRRKSVEVGADKKI